MRADLEHQLCEKYPEMMTRRHLSPQETCMCWGFECGDGWYTLIDTLMDQIQRHLNWQTEMRERVIKMNQIARDCKVGDYSSFNDQYMGVMKGEYLEARRVKLIKEPLQPEPQPIPPVVLEQVKEKFGTLRFYYEGGDQIVDGLVRMAEALSGSTCEVCGAPGHQRSGGWIKTLCDTHAQKKL